MSRETREGKLRLSSPRHLTLDTRYYTGANGANRAAFNWNEIADSRHLKPECTQVESINLNLTKGGFSENKLTYDRHGYAPELKP